MRERENYVTMLFREADVWDMSWRAKLKLMSLYQISQESFLPITESTLPTQTPDLFTNAIVIIVLVSIVFAAIVVIFGLIGTIFMVYKR